MGSLLSVRSLALLIVASLITWLAPAVAFGADGAVEHGASVSQAMPAVPHTPPVIAPVVDPFRPPPEPWLPGNRGIEYGPTNGLMVRASAPGVVTFAGSVAGNLFVTVAHDASLRTTVGFLDQISVSVGDSVQMGDTLGVAGDRLHFSARRDGVYIDPASLFQRYEIRIRLVP